MSEVGLSKNPFTTWVTRIARAHTPVMLQIAKREGVVGEDALDAAQEAFATLLQMPQARRIADHEQDSRGLLITLTRNIARNMRRRHFRARPHNADMDEEVLADDDMSVDAVIARVEEHTMLYGCIDQLANVQRQVVILRMLQEVSTDDVARELNLTPGHVAVLLNRAKKALLACMDH